MPKAFLIRSGVQRNFAHIFVLTLPTDLLSQIFHLLSPPSERGQSRHDPLKILLKGGVCKNSLGGDMHSHERLLVF